MSLLSFFKRAQEPEKDVVTQVEESFNRLRLEIFKTIADDTPGRHTWQITKTLPPGPRYGVNYFYFESETTIEAREALRRSQGFADVHMMCKGRNAHVEFDSCSNSGRDNALVTYITIDTSRPYSDPELPVGPNAVPSTILHGECLDDDPRIVYDNEGFPYLDDTIDTVDTVDVQKNTSIQPVAAKKAQQLTVPKITFSMARA